MKYVVLASVLFLTACKTETTDNEKVNGFGTACMSGVLYYFKSADGYGKSLAPVIDPETLTYVRCEAK